MSDVATGVAEAVEGSVVESLHAPHNPAAAVAEHGVGKMAEGAGTESLKERERGVLEWFTDSKKLAKDKAVGLGMTVAPEKISAAANRDPLKLANSGASWEEQAAAVDGQLQRLRSSEEYKNASPQQKLLARAQIHQRSLVPLYERAGKEAPELNNWLMNTMGGKIGGLEIGLDDPSFRGMSDTQAAIARGVAKAAGAWAGISQFGAALTKGEFLMNFGLGPTLLTTSPTKLKEEGVSGILKEAWDKAGGEIVNKWYRDSAQVVNTADFFVESHPRDGILPKMSGLAGETIATLPLYTALEEAKLGERALQPVRRYIGERATAQAGRAAIQGGIQTTDLAGPSLTTRLAQTLTGQWVNKRLDNAFVAVVGTMAQEGRITPRPSDVLTAGLGVGIGEALGGVKWAGKKTGVNDAMSTVNDWLKYVAGDIATGRKPITLGLGEMGERPETGLVHVRTTGAEPPPRTTGVPPPGKPLEGEYEPEGGFAPKEAEPQYMSQEEYEAAMRGRKQPTPAEGRPGAVVTPAPEVAPRLERGPIYGEAGEPTPSQKLLEGRTAKPETPEPAREGPIITPAPTTPTGLLERGAIWMGPGGSTGGPYLGDVETTTEKAAASQPTPTKPGSDLSHVPTMSTSAIEEWSANHLAMGGEPFSTGVITSAFSELTGQSSMSAEQIARRVTEDPVMDMMHKGEQVALQSIALQKYGKPLQALGEPAQNRVLMERFKIARTASFKLPALVPDLTLKEVTEGIQRQAAKSKYFKQALENLRAQGVDVPAVVAAKKIEDNKMQTGMISERHVTEGIGDIPPTKEGATPKIIADTKMRMDTMLNAWRKESPTIAKNFEGFIDDLRKLDGNKVKFQDDAHRLLFHYRDAPSEEIQRRIKDYLKKIIPDHNLLSGILKPGDKSVTQEHLKILKENLDKRLAEMAKDGRIKEGSAVVYRQTDLVSPSKYSSAELTSEDTKQMKATETMVKNSKGGKQALKAVRAVGNSHKPPVDPATAKTHDKIIDNTFSTETIDTSDR